MSDTAPLLSLEERAPLYAWLAPFFAREIDEETWLALREPSLATLLSGFDPALATWTEQAFTPELEEICAAEFARLFLLPRGVTPVASAWIEGNREKLGAELSTLVSRSYEVLGRAPAKDEVWGKLPQDHIGLLFDLASRAAVSKDALDQQVGQHLDESIFGEWLVRFGTALEEKAELPLYRALGRCIKELHSAPGGASD